MSEGSTELATEVDSSMRVNVGAGAAEPTKYRVRVVGSEERGRAADGRPSPSVREIVRDAPLSVPTGVAMRNFAIPAEAKGMSSVPAAESSKKPSRKVSKRDPGQRGTREPAGETPEKGVENEEVPPVRGSYLRRAEEDAVGKDARGHSKKDREKRRARR